jgi:hypothetical protein
MSIAVNMMLLPMLSSASYTRRPYIEYRRASGRSQETIVILSLIAL